MRSTGAVPTYLAKPIAVTGLLCFAGSLIYFVYRYVVVFGLETAGTPRASAVLANVAAFSGFALHHSVFARDACRRWTARLAGSLERSVYVWIASALFAAVCWFWRPVAGAAWRVEQPLIAWCLVAAQVLGIWLSVRSASLIDIRELSGLKQLDAAIDSTGRPLSDPPEFLTRGPYGWVRHPIYTGWFLIVFAVPVMTMTRLVFAVTSSVYLLIAIPFEERSLRQASRGAYDRYMRLVRWRLVPRVY